MGKTRSKQMTSKDGSFSTFPTQRWADKVLNVQVNNGSVIPIKWNHVYEDKLNKSDAW